MNASNVVVTKNESENAKTKMEIKTIPTHVFNIIDTICLKINNIFLQLILPLYAELYWLFSSSFITNPLTLQ